MFAIGIADSFMVASVGEEAVSAVSLVDSIMMLLITIMTALATGGAVVVGQFLGQKKQEDSQGKPEISCCCSSRLFLSLSSQ